MLVTIMNFGRRLAAPSLEYAGTPLRRGLGTRLARCDFFEPNCPTQKDERPPIKLAGKPCNRQWKMRGQEKRKTGVINHIAAIRSESPIASLEYMPHLID